MLNTVTTLLLWLGALGSALIAGVFFAFSTFIMASFARIEPSQGIAAMNSINLTILGSLFMPVFAGTALVGAAAAAIAIFQWSGATSGVILAAGVVYVAGSFISTIVFNVPLNDALAAFTANDTAALPLWQKYLQDWTFWNHVRTVASAAACALFVLALVWRAAPR